LTNDKTGYCTTHRPAYLKQNDERRLSAAERGYDSLWHRRRNHQLKEHPLCEDCLNEGRVTAAEMVHHIDGDPFNNDPSNYRSLCNPCHDKYKCK